MSRPNLGVVAKFEIKLYVIFYTFTEILYIICAFLVNTCGKSKVADNMCLTFCHVRTVDIVCLKELTPFLFFIFFFQPRSDLAALLQLLCSVFAAQPPVFSKTTPTPTQPSNYNRPQQPGYHPQYPPGYPSSNQAGSLPYPVGGPPGMPLPTQMPMPGKCKKKTFQCILLMKS